MMLEDIFQHEHAMAKKLCNENTWSLNKLGQKECQDKTLKLNLQQNYKKKIVKLKTKNVMQQKKLKICKNSGFRLWQNLKTELLVKLKELIFYKTYIMAQIKEQDTDKTQKLM